MRASQQLSAALAIGSASALIIPIPTLTLPTLALPTFTLPGFTLPTLTLGLPTPTKATSTTSQKTTSPATTSPSSKSSSTSSSVKASSFASSFPSGGVTSSTSKASTTGGPTPTLSVPTTTSKPSIAPSAPVSSIVSTVKSSAAPSGLPSSPASRSSSTIKPSVAPSSPVSSPSTSKPTSVASTLATSTIKPTASASPSVTASVKPSSAASKLPSSIVSSISSIKPSPTVSPQAYVNTTSGQLLCGTATNVTGVTACLGIPFAQPPVGNLRFAPPVAYTGNSIINATTYGADCACTIENVPTALGPRLYGLLGSLAQVGDPLSEDCLFINVWMKTQKSTTKKPVLVWIYGGGFNFGGSATGAYSGKYFAQDEDVVFVSINYRTNVLGFSGAPGLTQNVALLDQRMAIEWIRTNIAAFGGDPSRITIFGQSAGGASVDYYNYIWTKDPIVAGIIPMSGTATAFTARTPDQGATSWYNVTTTVGCGNSSTSTDDAIIACMRSAKITTAAIEAAAAPNPGIGSLLGNFGPVVDNTTIFPNYTDLAVKGNFIKKPTLAGNLNYEAGLFILIAAGAGQSYPQSFWDYVNTQVFTCPVSRLAQYSAQAGVPTWRYYYSGMYPNELIPTANISQAWHTSEIPVLFGTTEEIERNAGATVAESANTDPQVALAKYMRHAWATFAADPAGGLAGGDFGWPQYSASGDNVVFLGQNNQTVAFGPSSQITGPCS